MVSGPSMSRLTEAPRSADAGAPGASARQEYERRKASREARVKDRLGERLGTIAPALAKEPQTTRAWLLGADGERALGNLLDAIEGARVLHDRQVPRSRANIDHIVVGPGGVFVIDAKRYDGTISVRDRGSIFRAARRLYVGRRDCSALAAAVRSQADVVREVLVAAGADPLPPVTPVLVFVDGQWPLFARPTSYEDVRLAGVRSIRRIVAAPSLLTTADIGRLAVLIANSLPPK